jgi:hypothetical protein
VNEAGKNKLRSKLRKIFERINNSGARNAVIEIVTPNNDFILKSVLDFILFAGKDDSVSALEVISFLERAVSTRPAAAGSFCTVSAASTMRDLLDTRSAFPAFDMQSIICPLSSDAHLLRTFVDYFAKQELRSDNLVRLLWSSKLLLHSFDDKIAVDSSRCIFVDGYCSEVGKKILELYELIYSTK